MLRLVSNKKFIMIIAGFAILAFLGLVYFEWGKGGASSPNEIANINGRSIFLQDIKPIYEQMEEKYKAQINDENGAQFKKQLMVEALRSVAQKYIILDQAKKAKIGVSDDELLRTISRLPQFRTEEGKFNDRSYKRLPAYYKHSLEKATKEDLVSRLFQIRLLDTIKISDIDLRLFFMEKNTKCKIRFVMLEVKPQTQSQNVDNLMNVNEDRVKAEKKIQQFLKTAQRSKNFIGAASSVGLRIKTTDYFGFFQPIQKPGNDDRYKEIEFQDVYLNAFKLKPGQISGQINLNKGFAVIQLLSKSQPNWDKFYKDLPNLKAEYEAKLRQYVMQEWFLTAEKNSKVKNYLYKLFQQQESQNN